MNADGNIGVLIVDDEVEVTTLYEEWLAAHRTHVAHDGQEALTVLDRRGEEIDVVLLDRKMPTLSGSKVLERIRAQAYDCRVAMITAVAPDYDIIDMSFDEYITKPVDGDTIRRTVEALYSRAQYAETLTHYYSLVSTHANLLAEHSYDDLQENDEFVSLETEIESVRRSLDSSLEVDDHREFQHVLREIQ
ncbi:HalX domain-containing protein [Haladaptatus paucihalophilus DX253]|uniref:HalX domain-containing protein n=1 Tax=Haladaptatus paucihalophilus DX253 TaxID=797209 RepID=A0A1M6VQZ7_HALPU|nr:DNA-binding protein [Haladaptatus sp. T7]SHK83646.1 HalX domain-containing protein [Haladaptatus paucihalophilus DX253]